MLTQQQTEDLLKDTKTKIDEGCSWEPVRVYSRGKLEIFDGIKLRHGTTPGGRYAELVAIRCDSGRAEFDETSMQIEVGAGFFPVETDDDRVKENYGYTPYVRFLELSYPF